MTPRKKKHQFPSIAVILMMMATTLTLPTVNANTSCVSQSSTASSCFSKYYKISDESNGLATSCAAVDQTADPVVGLDEAGCQAACDDTPGCNTVNFRWSDPNFGAKSTCYRKKCDDFHTAACTLFTNHKGRDVFTKACGASSLYLDHIETDSNNGLFAGVICPDSSSPEIASILEQCAVEGGTTTEDDKSCANKYYKISDESNGLATSCAAVEQTADPVVGVSQAQCQSMCDDMEGCNTVNFRWSDPNFGGESTCYRKNCDDFTSAACTLFTNHKGRDVYTKACEAEELYENHVQADSVNGLFAGVKCPLDEEGEEEGGNDGERVCQKFTSTNRTSDQCDICYEWSGGSSQSDAVRRCRLWEKAPGSDLYSCFDYAPSAVELKQQEDYQKYLITRWSEVGLCDLEYTRGTTCTLEKEDGSVCEVRDQPCQGDVTGIGGVAGVLSKGWQMTFSTEQDNHVCTMCGRGTYGSCEDACSYRRNFFWSGYGLGRKDVDLNGQELEELYNAFIQAQPEEDYDVPQTLELTPDVLAFLPDNHTMKDLSSRSIYSIIQANLVSVTVRDQLRYIYISVQNMEENLGEVQYAPVVLSTSGVKVYETCSCKRCPRGLYQDSLGETHCKACNDVLPGSDTMDMGADGPQLCKCLQSNDVFLSGDESECLHCDFVRNGTAAAPEGICECPADTYEISVEAGQLGVPENATTRWITCNSCHAYSSTFNDETMEHVYGSSIDNCYCEAGFYQSSPGVCSSCGTSMTSDWNAMSEDECYLTESIKLLAIILPTGFTLFAAVMLIISSRYRAKIKKLEDERIRAMKEKILYASESVNSLAHPMILITADDFLLAGKMVKHEEARKSHILHVIDTNEDLKQFRKTAKVVFFSHQWLAWSEPDPQRIQYDAMVYAMKALLEREKIDIKSLYVWLDYTCIPQAHPGLQRLSINSLPMYAGACDYFVIVAPGPITHADTQDICDPKSYQDRAWCRAEQLSHGARVGVKRMFIAKGNELEPVTWDWIKPSFQIFKGNLTCCARKHVGMDQCDKEFLITPVLGLYCELLEMERCCSLPSQKREVLEFMKTHRDDVFPRTFQMSTPSGKMVRRELFGDIISLVEEDEELRSETMTEITVDDSIDKGKVDIEVNGKHERSMSIPKIDHEPPKENFQIDVNVA